MQIDIIISSLDIVLLIYIVFSTIDKLKFIRENQFIPTAFILFFVLCISHVLPIYLGRISVEGVEKFHLGVTSRVLGESSQPWVFLFYRIMIFAVLLVISCFGTNGKTVRSFENDITTRFIVTGRSSHAVFFCWFIFMLSPLCVFISPDPFLYFQVYGTPILRADASEHPALFLERHIIISYICVMGIGLFSLIYWFHVRATRTVFYPPMIFGMMLAGLLIMIEGKRNTVFLLFLIVLLITYYETRIKAVTIYVLLFLGLMVFFVIYPYFGKADVDVTYENSQNTFFRDNITLPCIANSHLTDNDIMKRGNGAVFVVSMFVPRKFYPLKPYPSSHYVTNYLIGRGDDEIGWGYGVGFLEEGLVNFGWLGVLFYTMGMIVCCRLVDRQMIRYGSAMTLLQGLLAFSCLFSAHVVIRLFLLGGLPLLVFWKYLFRESDVYRQPCARE